MTELAQLAERYIAMWNETDAAARRRLVADLWADDARYVDPMVVAEGRDAIDAAVGAAQEQFPGWEFRLAGPVDAHHDAARFTWELGPAGGEAVVVGFDVAERDRDGRLATVVGFLDRVPTG